MTKTPFQWVTWRWVNPLWWAERQIEATAFMLRLTGTVADAAITSVCGVAGRSVPPPAASVYAQAAEAVTATVTAPAAAPAPTPVPVPRWEAPEPHRELTAVKPARQLKTAVPEAVPEAAHPGPQLKTAVPGTGPEVREVTERARAEEPLVPGWDELTLGSIRARLRRLSEEDLVALLGYEERHADRPDVLSMLQNRLTKVRSADQGS